MDIFNFLDIAIIVIVLFCLFRSLFRGFIMEVASLAGVIAGFILANNFYLEAAKKLKASYPGFSYWEQAGWVLIFLLSMVAANLVGLLIKKFAKLTLLSWMDRLLGASFGLLKGLLISAILVAFLTLFLPANSRIFKRSSLLPYIKETTRYLMVLAPKEVRDKLDAKEKGLNKLWRRTVEAAAERAKKEGRKMLKEKDRALKELKR